MTLRKSIGNIIENACKYGRNRIEVEVKITNENSLQLVISDDGSGLSQEQMNKVFARGFRIDEQKPGSLGLNIVKDIVETYMKGQVDLQKSKRLGGLEVTIFLPLSMSQKVV